jgi:hypothetical protein
MWRRDNSPQQSLGCARSLTGARKPQRGSARRALRNEVSDVGSIFFFSQGDPIEVGSTTLGYVSLSWVTNYFLNFLVG